jgi:zinc transporter ZupT
MKNYLEETFVFAGWSCFIFFVGYVVLTEFGVIAPLSSAYATDTQAMWAASLLGLVCLLAGYMLAWLVRSTESTP